MKKFTALVAALVLCLTMGMSVFATESPDADKDVEGGHDVPVEGGSGDTSGDVGADIPGSGNGSSGTSGDDEGAIIGDKPGDSSTTPDSSTAPTTEPNGGSGSGSDESKSPVTGDTWIVPGLGTIALAGITVSAVAKKKEE